MSDQETIPASTGGTGGGSTPSKEEKQWAMFTHLGAFGGLIIPYVGNVLGPLIIWRLKKEEMPFVNDQGKEAINFQISMVIYGLVALALCLVFIGFLLLPAVAIADLIFVIIATIKAGEGVAYRYPLTIRFIK